MDGRGLGEWIQLRLIRFVVAVAQRVVVREPSNKKPGTQAGFIVESHVTRATAYPAECRYNGRRARDVMPAAARALVSTVAV